MSCLFQEYEIFVVILEIYVGEKSRQRFYLLLKLWLLFLPTIHILQEEIETSFKFLLKSKFVFFEETSFPCLLADSSSFKSLHRSVGLFTHAISYPTPPLYFYFIWQRSNLLTWGLFVVCTQQLLIVLGIHTYELEHVFSLV